MIERTDTAQVVTISRAGWLRNTPSLFEGKYPGGFLLYKSDNGEYPEFEGKKCCLGFGSCQLGEFTEEEICGNKKLMPFDLDDSNGKFNRLPLWLTATRGDSAKLAVINDNGKLSDAEKEAAITKIFGKHGIKVVFTE